MKQTSTVEKGSKEFSETKHQYLQLFKESKDSDMVRKGIFEHGEHKGKALGITSKKILNANLPMPFGCPELFAQPTEGGGIIWFCDRVGCICVCCREDFTGEKEKYPVYCPTMTPYYGEYCDCGSSTCDQCNPGWEDESFLEELDDFNPYDDIL